MGEIKSVKVDNWGVFFLQKLQNFFNKTDYCDLTLQFDDNSQLKVHRLVLSACTDYFNVLENTYDVTDDILIMPRELQADVVVPIVNFMYTGTLEFEISMYGRLLKTAKDMNMTVLLKLLEAHKRTVEGSRGQTAARATQKAVYSTQRKPAPVVRAIRPVERTYSSSASTSSSLQQHHANLQQQLQQQRRVQVQPKTTQYKNIQIKTVNPIITSGYRKTLPEPAAIVAKYSHNQTTVKGPSRFECGDETILPPDSFESSFDNISYESKPLITANQICKEERDMEDYDQYIPAHKTLNQTSPFEQLRRSYTNSSNKRPPSTSAMGEPPEKKPNIQDVKEYAEQQRMRKQIAAEYDDDHEYDDVLDDEFHNDDDDEDYVPPAHIQKQQTQQVKAAPARPILITQDSDRKSSTIVLKNSGPDTDHAKIISEVLKKYPHLVKKTDNVKFQITSKYGKTTTQKVVIKEEPNVAYKAEKKTIPVPVVAKPKPQPEVSPQPSTSKAAIAAVAAAAAAPTPSMSTAQPKRIDSKTMHALIALGAENTTGPWLCLRCGVNGRPISIPSYRGFRRHLINTHKEKIDPRLCEHCGWRSRDTREMFHHMLVKHSIKPPANFQFPSCDFCPEILLNEDAFTQHMEVSHPEYKETFNQCMYCNKTFENETLMYNHVRSKHKIQAQEDGVLEYSDNDDSMDSSKFVSKQIEQQPPPAESGNEKIKILSDISISQSLPLIETAAVLTGNEITIAPSSEAESLNTVATGIATSLGLVDNAAVIDDSQILSTEYINAEMEAIHSDFDKKVTKFMTSDGSVMELTDAQRDEIISQLDDQHNSEVVMVLNQDTFESEETTARNTETTHQAFGSGDESMFIVYSQSSEPEKTKNGKDPKDATEKRKTNEEASTSQIDWQDAAVSEIFEGSSNDVVKKEDSSADENEGETDDMCVLNDSEDNIEKVIREMDQGYVSEKPSSKVEDAEEKSNPVSEKTQSKEDEAKTNKLKLLTVDWTDDEEDESDLKDESLKSEEAEATTKQTSLKSNESTELLYEITTNSVSDKEGNQRKVSPNHDATSSDKCFSEEGEESAAKRTDKRSSSQADDEQELEKFAAKTTEKQKSVEEQIPEENETSESNKDKATSQKDEIEPNDDDKVESETSETEKKPVKPEISNLISDWGDEDEEEI